VALDQPDPDYINMHKCPICRRISETAQEIPTILSPYF